MATPAGISPVQQNIPVAQPIPVAYPVAVVRADQRAREDAELLREGAVRHDLKAGDTVPSLAMKYGVSAEVIRRRNKLWSHDSLAARSFVIIPKGTGDEEIDSYLPYRESRSTPGGLDKTSVDRLFSSCDGQIQATRSALSNRFTGTTAPPPGSSYEGGASASAIASASSPDSRGLPPSYEDCTNVAETSLDTPLFLSDMGQTRPDGVPCSVQYMPSSSDRVSPGKDELLAEL